jgi:DNA invertase Pin-like site-specific DNA recombinase/DNA-binding transcriptional MerR regulator
VSTDTTTKVNAARLARDAYLYVRQSTLYQVANNTESTMRQYDLKGRAVALGWPSDRIHVIDIDQGHSGASAADREGFQHLVAQVSLGRAGIVLGLECSRLARNSADWHRLLQICAHNDTLICDEDGLYDPTSFNDRLLLGMKGQLSEAELHFLRSRMQGGLLAKARRGELRTRLPIGLVHDHGGSVTLDPDAGVRQAVRLALDTFTATGSARAVVKAFADAGLTFPGRHLSGPHHGQLYWKQLRHGEVLDLLHNPGYAGAYVYGRRKHTTDLDGRHHSVIKPVGDWTVLIHDHHPGYLTWRQYEHNQQVLAANAAARGDQRAAGPAREGPGLLQGLVICGRCGHRMSVGYHQRAGGVLVPDYKCQRESIAAAVPECQAITGAGIDAAIARLVLDTLTPLALEVALTITDELAHQSQQADALRAGHVQRAQHGADAARRRYLAVDPGNRLVADTLEADWNAALRDLAAANDDYQKARTDADALTEQQRERIRALAGDFPALWNDPATPIRERKRLIRLLVADVTLTRHPDGVTAQVRLPGGQQHTLRLPRPRTAYELHTTDPATVTLIDQLLDHHPVDEIVTILNERQITGGWGRPFTNANLAALCQARHLTSHADRLRALGMLTTDQIAADLGVSHATIRTWHRAGLITGRRVDGRGEHVYHPGQHRPDRPRLAAGRPADTAHLLTSGQLATKLAVCHDTVSRWHHLGLIDSPARDQRGFNLYHPDQARPTPAQVTAAGRPPDTQEAITGGRLALRLSVSRSTIYKWYRLGLIDSLGVDNTGRHLYHRDQQAPDPTRIAAARTTARGNGRHHPRRASDQQQDTAGPELSDPSATIDFTSPTDPSAAKEPESST